MSMFFFLRFVFVRHLLLDQYISDEDYKLYVQISNDILDNLFEHHLDKFVFRFVSNSTTIDTCLDRIHKRNRPGEEKITRKYLESLEQLHSSFFTSLFEIYEARELFNRVYMNKFE